MSLQLDLNWQENEFRLAVSETIQLEGVTALFGPSGAGKSSVLRAIGGFLPKAGLVSYQGSTWQSVERSGDYLPPHKRPVGTVFQKAHLFPHLNVQGNLDYATVRADRQGPAIEFDEVVGTLEIRELLARQTTTLSGGEAQRVAIARALLARPRLMLMDEPLSGIDRARKNTILGMIADLPRKFQVPVIFVSHLVEEVAHISTQLVAMQQGRIVGTGSTTAMLERLGAEVTGHFETGSILEGDVVECDAELSMIALDIAGVLLWMPSTLTVAKGERLRVRLRARDVSLSLEPLTGVSIRNQLPVKIVDITEEDGPFAELRLDCAGQIIRARLTRLSVQDLSLRPGQDAYALVKSVAFDRRLGSSATV